MGWEGEHQLFCEQRSVWDHIIYHTQGCEGREGRWSVRLSQKGEKKKEILTSHPSTGVADPETSSFPLLQRIPLTVRFEACTMHGSEDARATDSAREENRDNIFVAIARWGMLGI